MSALLLLRLYTNFYSTALLVDVFGTISWTETATPARNHQEIKIHKKYTKLWLRVLSFIHSLRTATTAAVVAVVLLVVVADVGFTRKHFPRKSKENKKNIIFRHKESENRITNLWMYIRFARDWIVYSLFEPSRVVQIEPIVINQDIHIVRWLTKEPRKKIIWEI